MKVKLKYFASIAEAVSIRGEEMELRDGMIVSDLLETLKKRYKCIGEMSNVLVALNGTYVDPNTPLVDDDVIAFFPSVSGG